MGDRSFDGIGVNVYPIPPGSMGDSFELFSTECDHDELGSGSTGDGKRLSYSSSNDGAGRHLGYLEGNNDPRSEEDFIDEPSCMDDRPDEGNAARRRIPHGTSSDSMGLRFSQDSFLSRLSRRKSRKKIGLHLFVPPNLSAAGGFGLPNVDEEADSSMSGRSPRFALWARQVLSSVEFNMCIGAAIVVNALINGMELDQHPAAKGSDVMLTFADNFHVSQTFFNVCESCFLVLLGLEFGMRLYVTGWETLCTVSAYMDFLALAPALVMFVVDLKAGENATALRLVRLLKLLRLLRLFGIFVEIKAFFMTVASALRALFWIFMMMLFLVYFSAVLCTILVGHSSLYAVDNPIIQRYEDAYGEEVNINRYWGSTTRSMFTLFQVFTLDDWNMVVRPIVETHSPWMTVFFVLFIFVTTFGLLNLLMGTIVDAAISKSKQADKEQEKILQMDYNKVILATMRLFSMIDVGNNGLITPKEIELFLRHNSIQDVLQKDFEHLNIHMDYTELSAIYEIIIEDWSGSKAQEDAITPEEFAGAAMRLQGQAKSRDMLMVLVTVQSMMGRLEKIEKGQRKLQTLLDKHAKAHHGKLHELSRLTRAVRDVQREMAAQLLHSRFGSEMAVEMWDSEKLLKPPSQAFPEKVPTAPALPMCAEGGKAKPPKLRNARCSTLDDFHVPKNGETSPKYARAYADSSWTSRQNTEDSFDMFKVARSSTVSEETAPEERSAMKMLLSQRDALVRHGGDCMSNLMKRLPTLENFVHAEVKHEVRGYNSTIGKGGSQANQPPLAARRASIPSDCPVMWNATASAKAAPPKIPRPPPATPAGGTTPRSIFSGNVSTQEPSSEMSEDGDLGAKGFPRPPGSWTHALPMPSIPSRRKNRLRTNTVNF